MCVLFASGNQFLKQKENQDIFLIIQKQLKLKKHQIESYYVILKLENLMCYPAN